MTNNAILQVRMPAETKRDVEALYKELGTSFAEAVRIFANLSIEEQACPIKIRITKPPIHNAAKGMLAHRARPVALSDEKKAFEEAISEEYAKKNLA